MKSDTDSETNAAAQAAGRELMTSALQRNPLVAFGALLVNPILGLFRRHRVTTATQVEKLRLERFSSRTEPPPNRHIGARPEPERSRAEGLPSARRSRNVAASHVRKGGYPHG
jgi:hypothetical protein